MILAPLAGGSQMRDFTQPHACITQPLGKKIALLSSEYTVRASHPGGGREERVGSGAAVAAATISDDDER